MAFVIVGLALLASGVASDAIGATVGAMVAFLAALILAGAGLVATDGLGRDVEEPNPDQH